MSGSWELAWRWSSELCDRRDAEQCIGKGRAKKWDWITCAAVPVTAWVQFQIINSGEVPVGGRNPGCPKSSFVDFGGDSVEETARANSQVSRHWQAGGRRKTVHTSINNESLIHNLLLNIHSNMIILRSNLSYDSIS